VSNHITSAVYKRQLGTHMRKSVMALLADKASDDGSGIWASKQTLADELCCSKQTVIATIQGFIADGLLHESGTRKCSTGATVEYRIDVAAIDALPLVDCHAKRSSALTGQAASPVKSTAPRGQAAGPKPSRTPQLPKKGKPSLVARPKKSPIPKHPLPDGWEPKPLTLGSICAQIVSRWQPGRIERELSKFRDHALKTGAQWSDWDAAWRTWVQRADDYGGDSHGRPSPLGRHQPAGPSSIAAAQRVFGTG
jgi:hypothetical protein